MRRRDRIHALLGALPLAGWTLFHLWEQWAVFQGREAWVARMRETSRGPVALSIELAAIVLPLAVWSGLALADLARQRRLPGAARDGDAGLVRAIGVLGPIGTALSILFLAIHVGSLWGPRVVAGADELETWAALTHDLGRPWMLVLYAVGLTAIALHLAAAIPAALEALGWIESAEARRQSLLVSSVLALSIWVLSAQLVGWLGTGAGTFWPITVVDAPPGEP